MVANNMPVNESRLRKYLILNVDDLGHFCPIEAHVSQPGIPDYSYTVGGINGWLELKFGTASKSPHLRLMQRVWMDRNIKHGGNPLIFLGVISEDHPEFGIIHGNKAERLYAARTNTEWIACCSTVWPDRVIWSEFISILRNPESQA